MGLFSKIFGGGDVSLASVRKAVEGRRFADALRLAGELDQLGDEERDELSCLQIVAGDGLAQLNLDEALGLHHCGKLDQAEECFQLALEKVCSPDLRAEIERIRDAVESDSAIDEPESSFGCADCSSGARVDIENPEVPEDRNQQLELILTSYPSDLAARYFDKSTPFLDGFILAQTGQDEDAARAWAAIDPAEHDDIYCFEFGALLARNGDLPTARKLLEAALQKNENLLIAVESLIPVLVALEDFKGAEDYLTQLLNRGVDPTFCNAQLSVVQARKGEIEQAVDSARQAVAKGVSDPSYIVFAANLFETSGALDEAEELLSRLPVSGCRGGLNLPLAEFLLRRKKDLGRILDTFNAACRDEPENPRWQLRVAQTYLARQWKKDGVKLLEKVAGDPRLEPDLAEEAQQLLQQVRGAA